MRLHDSILKKLILLSFPIIISNLINASSSLISMFFIAMLNPEALAAGAIITSTYGLIVMLVVALLYSVSIMVGQNHGAARFNEAGSIVFSGVTLAFILGVPLTCLMLNITPILIWLHQPAQVSELVGEYFHGIAYGLIPSLIGATYTQFFLGVSKAKTVFYFTTMGVLINSILSYLFIFGYGWCESYGVFGAGLANSLTACILLIVMLVTIKVSPNLKKYQLFSRQACHLTYLNILFKIGFPISLQYGAELLAFSVITFLMGSFGATALGAQQITLQCSMIAIMVVMGISQAATILTSQALGEKNTSSLRVIANYSFMLGIIFMLVVAFVYWFIPLSLISFYMDIHNPYVQPMLDLAKTLLAIAAFTQLFDAGRNIAAGLLRGLGDTKSSMWTSMISCWLIGIPASIILAFIFDLGAIGLRLGIMLGILVGSIHLVSRVYKGKLSYTEKSFHTRQKEAI